MSNQRGCVNWFFGINTGKTYTDVEAALKTYRGRIPSRLFPIGDDPGGNLICLSTAGSDAGAVFFWDHEFEREEPTEDNVYFIAGSFEEFLNGLYAPTVTLPQDPRYPSY